MNRTLIRSVALAGALAGTLSGTSLVRAQETQEPPPAAPEAPGGAAPEAPAPAAPDAPEAPASPRQQAEQVLRKAYAWLLGQQRENGSFGKIPGLDEKAGEAGMSALALRAMAKAPPSIRRDLGAAMDKTADYLLKLQAGDGSITNPGAGLTTYRTSIALTAFNAHDPSRHAEAIQKARAYLEKTQWSEAQLGQDPAAARKSPYYGGWGYDAAGTKPDADLSNVHFAIEALHEAGVPKESPVFQRAITFLQRCQNRSESNDLVPAKVRIGDDGGFMYDPGLDKSKSEPEKNPDGTLAIPSYASMTYAGLMSMLHANLPKDDARVKAARLWIERNYTLEENFGLGSRANAQGGKQGLYYYYHTFAKGLAAWGEPVLSSADGTEHRWADELVRVLGAQQHADGYWKNEVKRWWEDDPVLCTCYALIAIEAAEPFLSGAAAEGAGAGK